MSRDEAKSTSPGMKNAPPPDHAARFGRGGLRRRVHRAFAIGVSRANCLIFSAIS
jgi:hypothetical protein